MFRNKKILGVLFFSIALVFSNLPSIPVYAAPDTTSSATTAVQKPLTPMPAIPKQSPANKNQTDNKDMPLVDTTSSEAIIPETASLNEKNPSQLSSTNSINPTDSTQQSESSSTPAKLTYSDGTYRGVFYDGGTQQIGLQFTLKDNAITEIRYRRLFYKDVDYLKNEEPKTLALKKQYEEAIAHIKGLSPAEASTLLKTSKTLANDQTLGTDTLSGATIRSSKIASALQDGLQHGVYSRKPKTKYHDGVYRGIFIDGGVQQVGVQFTLKDQIVQEAKYRTLFYKDVDYLSEKDNLKIMNNTKQFQDLLNAMVGKDIRVYAPYLRTPELFVTNQGSGMDAVSAATLRSNKVLSAIQDGLNRGVYKPSGDDLPMDTIFSRSFEDGTYRGFYMDKNEQQVGISFKLNDGQIKDIKFRRLAFKDTDYLKASGNSKEASLAKQYGALLSFVNGHPLKETIKLYQPGSIVSDEVIGTDVISGATLRSQKVISAIADALNRGFYSK